MENHLKRWMKGTFVVSLLMGASVAQASMMVEQQVINGTAGATTGLGGNNVQSGGNHVAIEGEWAFVGNTDQCQVFVYKWDPFTYKWGDGGHWLSDNSFGNAPTEGLPYTILNEDGNACQSNSKEGFGSAISTDAGVVAVGAPLTKAPDERVKHGAVFLYKYEETLEATDTTDNRHGWVRIDSVEKPKDWIGGAAVSDVQKDAAYGAALSYRSTAEDGDGISIAGVLIVGAPLYDVDDGLSTEKVNAGKVYVWEWSGSFALVDGKGGEYAADRVGHSVTSNGTELLASAPLFDEGGLLNAASGAVYHFNYNTTAHTLDLIHRFDSTDPVFPSVLPAGFSLGWAVSYADDLIAMSGKNTFMVKYVAGTPPTYAVINEFSNTNGGDVSQSGKVINIAVRGKLADSLNGSFNVYFDKDTVVPADAPDVTYTKTEDNYGEDISLSIPKLMVNGYDATDASAGETIDNPNKGGVAYAYYPTCGFGDKLVHNEWKMFGLQCDVFTDSGMTSRAGIEEMFGSDLGIYGTNWIMYRQDGTNYSGAFNDYYTMQPDDTMELGVGYWIKWLGSAADESKAFQINQKGLSGNDLYARYIPKVIGPDPLDDGTDRDYVDAVTDLNLRNMMVSTPINGRNGDDDVRTMFSNQLTVATVWANAYMYIYETGTTNMASMLVGNGAIDYFDNGNPTAYVYHNDNGPVGQGFTAVPGTPGGVPGLAKTIAAGEGFSVVFDTLFTDFMNDTTAIPSLHLAEEY